MNKQLALQILTEMQKWRRADPPYDEPERPMPYTPTQYGEALDYAIKALSE